jgi:hypothetical protein
MQLLITPNKTLFLNQSSSQNPWPNKSGDEMIENRNKDTRFVQPASIFNFISGWGVI